MKKTKRILTWLFWTVLVEAAILVVLFETDLLPSGILSDHVQLEFLLLTLMELVSLAVVYGALRLFKFQKIHADLIQYKEEALQKWGVVRLAMLELPLLLNVLFYYLFMQTTFGYMAIILLLALVFVYPTEGRCLSETETEEQS